MLEEQPPEISEPEEAQRVDENLQNYLASIIRPQKGTLADLLAVELSIACYSPDPTMKIRHTLEAFFLLDDEKQKKIATDDQINEYQKIYSLALSFQMMPEVGSYFSEPYDPDRMRYLCVPFPFMPKDVPKYFDYFGKITIRPALMNADQKTKWEKLNARLGGETEDLAAWNEYYIWLYRDMVTGLFNISLCLQMKALFVNKAMPTTLKLLKLIFENFVSPTAWQGMIGSKEGRGGYK